MGWVCAATLVNLNAWVGYSRLGADIALAVAVLSLLAALGLGGLFIYKGLPTAAVAVAWALAGVSYGKPVGQDAEALGEYTLRGAMIVFRTTGVLLGLTAIAHGAMYARIRKKLMIENELKRSSRPQWTKGAPPAATASPIRTPKSLRPSTIRTPRSFGPRFAYFAFAGFWGRGYIMGVYGTPCG